MDDLTIISKIEDRAKKTNMTFRLKYFPFSDSAYWVGHFRSEGGEYISGVTRHENLVDCLSGVLDKDEIRGNPIRSAEIMGSIRYAADSLINESDNETYRRFGEHLEKVTDIISAIMHKSDEAHGLIAELLNPPPDESRGEGETEEIPDQIMDDIIKRIEKIEKAISAPHDSVLTLDQAAHFLGVSKATLYKYTAERRMPHYKPTGRRIYFKGDELEKWITDNPISNNR